jgi:hypothetical protein
MANLRKYLELQAQAKTGLSSALFVWGLVAVVFGILTAGFILLIAFIWLAERYGPLIAAAILAGLFLLVTIVAIAVCSHGAEPLNGPRWRSPRANIRFGSNRSWLRVRFRRAARSAGAGSFRCSLSAFSPPLLEWNGRAAASRRAGAMSKTAAVSSLAPRDGKSDADVA